MARFKVDTHLFRELGELLVGRDSTALVELVKNSYDADATLVSVKGEGLRTSSGRIEIVDDGNGMTPDQFVEGFLTIASRTKETGDRRSPRFGRRYTGAKGVGRLAAHKLARRLEVRTFPHPVQGTPRLLTTAVIDWDELEQHSSLDETGDAISVESTEPSSAAACGTTIALWPLRRPWSEVQLSRFLAEVEGFAPPAMLLGDLSAVVGERLLFETITARDQTDGGPDTGFAVDLLGDFDTGDDFWDAALQTATWIVEISADVDGAVSYQITPTRRTTSLLEPAQSQTFTAVHPSPETGPFFQARILVREGELQGSRQLKSWARAAAGVRVFMEGFRVLPYGERGDDWLSLAADTTRRTADSLRELDRVDFDGSTPDSVERDYLSILPPQNYFGAVLLREETARGLRMVVNREGFVPDEAFESLRSITRAGIDLSVRVRAGASAGRRRTRRQQRKARPKEGLESGREVVESMDRLENTASELRTALEGPKPAAGLALVNQVQQISAHARRSVAALLEDQAVIRVTASAGTQMASFVHELASLVTQLAAVDVSMSAFADRPEVTGDLKQEIRAVALSLSEVRQGLDRQASFLSDIVSADSRRRRRTHVLRDVFEATSSFYSRAASDRGIAIVNRLPPDLVSRPMFRAELGSIFSNLLSNAIKAANADGEVMATGSSDESGGVSVQVQNTGVAVDPSDGERWFRPYASTTAEADPVLGLGMGLGLSIARAMVEQYGGTLRFVAPDENYATAIEFWLPKK